MTTEKELVYIKFFMDEKLGVMRTLDIAEDKAYLTDKTPDIRSDTTKIETINISHSFESISQELIESMEVFSGIVPFIMNTLPVLSALDQDKKIRTFVKQHGRALPDEPELYELSIDHLTEVTDRVRKLASIRMGINNLPNMVFVGLISAYDLFLGSLVRLIIEKNPEIISSSDKNISFKDLLEAGSIQGARDRIIDKQIENLLRESHSEQILWIEKQLKVTLRSDTKVWKEFIEVCERRNLLTHTDGIVSSQYLRVCKEHGIETGDINLGDKLETDDKYYRRSVWIVLEFGYKLTQVIWRKLCPEEIESASISVSDFGYSLIAEKNTQRRVRSLILA